METEERNMKWRILVCDDEPDIREIVARTLSLKYEVATAENGLDLLNKIDMVEPDLIVLDIMMPIMNGYQACASVRKLPRFKDTPIYFLTAKSQSDDIKTAYSLGATFYITKPFDPLRLLKNLELHFENPDVSPIAKALTIQEIQEREKQGSVTTTADVKPDRELGRPEPRPVTVQEKMKLKPRILIVDDDHDVLTLMIAMLKSKYEPLATSDPIEAVELVARAEPDIIIMDVAMPKLDGFQLARLIKNNRRVSRVEMIFVSAHSDTGTINKAKQISENPFIAKPFDMSTADTAIQEVIAKRSFRVRAKTTDYKKIYTELEIMRQKEKEKDRKKKEKAFQKKKFENIRAIFKKEMNDE